MSKVSLEPQQEQQLITAAQKDPSKFGPLYTHYYPYILKYIIRKVGDESTAEDLCAQVFEKALKNITKFKWQGHSISAWFYQIARNAVTDYYRKSSRQKSESLENQQDLQIANYRTPHDEFEIDYYSTALKKILDNLPERDRKVVYLKFFYGYTNGVIAKVTKLSTSNVGTILHRSVKKMKAEMAKHS